ncbi:MAG: hypothetical protein ACRDL6_03455 [Solirubrobacterales bacterium]
MRRSTGTFAVGALALLTAAVGIASASHGGGAGPHDFAVGAAKNTFATGTPNHLMVSAQGAGPAATGHVRAKGDLGGEFTLEGEVTCLRVEGNRAAIKYRFKHATGSAAPLEGGGVQVFVEDNGDPSGGQAVDRNTFDPPQPAGVFDLNATQCDDPTARPDYDPVDSGDYTVHDAG